MHHIIRFDAELNEYHVYRRIDGIEEYIGSRSTYSAACALSACGGYAE